ncbi:hypothetical protein [Sphingobacterium spiritivorum]|uniref:hypothetical protein n=1 Tax=Sphingobacterium spiritivorum TaxID=258 RepID=UPI001917C209|nr:hypothetical protein [Sphingobacterium spiritivorum]QQT24232.1 hypothetical protein I6J02_10670 [Sphingobacterium spiritivorum]
MSEKLLITYGTRGLAQRIARLIESKISVQLASSEEVPGILVSSGKVLQIPAGGQSTYAHEVLKVSLDQDISYILPLGKEEINVLAEAQILFEEYGIRLLLPAKELLSDIFVLEDPDKDMAINILLNGKDLLTEEQIRTSNLSGAFVLADSEDEQALCLVSAKG